MNDNEILYPSLTFDDNGNVFIPKTEENQTIIFNDFIHHLLTNRHEGVLTLMGDATF